MAENRDGTGSSFFETLRGEKEGGTVMQTETVKKSEKTATKAEGLRKKLKMEHRKKLALKIKQDAEFKKNYFAAKSKRSNEKKVAFRKRHVRKSK